jgi:hypothetical protein
LVQFEVFNRQEAPRRRGMLSCKFISVFIELGIWGA